MKKEPVKKAVSKLQRLVRPDNVIRRKNDGWKIVGNEKNRKQLSGEDEMILMEK